MSEPAERALEPARPDADDLKEAYARANPWKWIAGVVLSILLITAFFIRSRSVERGRLEAEIRRTTASVAPLLERFSLERGMLETWIVDEAARDQAAPFREERLTFERLSRTQGVYVRLKAAEARDRAAVARAARAMTRDGVTSCMALSPVAFASFYDLGRFAEPTWAAEIRGTSDPGRLEVKQHELGEWMKRDVPRIGTLLQSSWMMILIERGTTRHQGPVDVSLWDIRSKKLLLRTRVQARGSVLSARAAFNGAPRLARSQTDVLSVAQDCSIGTQIKDAIAPTAPPPVPPPTAQAEEGAEPVGNE